MCPRNYSPTPVAICAMIPRHPFMHKKQLEEVQGNKTSEDWDRRSHRFGCLDEPLVYCAMGCPDLATRRNTELPLPILDEYQHHFIGQRGEKSETRYAENNSGGNIASAVSTRLSSSGTPLCRFLRTAIFLLPRKRLGLTDLIARLFRSFPGMFDVRFRCDSRKPGKYIQKLRSHGF